jgi:hypothetical protein
MYSTHTAAAAQPLQHMTARHDHFRLQLHLAPEDTSQHNPQHNTAQRQAPAPCQSMHGQTGPTDLCLGCTAYHTHSHTPGGAVTLCTAAACKQGTPPAFLAPPPCHMLLISHSLHCAPALICLCQVLVAVYDSLGMLLLRFSPHCSSKAGGSSSRMCTVLSNDT